MKFKNVILLFILISINSCGGDSEDPCTPNPTLTSNDVTEITDTSAKFSGKIIAPTCDATVTSQGFVYSKTTLPSINDNIIKVNGSDISANVNNLNQNTKYYIRSFFTNPIGTFYGNEVTFTTNAGAISLTTNMASNFTPTSALIGGYVINDGGSSIVLRGVCWSTSQNPTISANKTNDGAGIGNFISNISNINSNQVYYVRAYATNTQGSTYYGNEVVLQIPQLTYIPDDNFEQAIINLGKDDFKNDYVETQKIKNITQLDVSQKSIKNLTGIEDFTSLISLKCFNNQLSSLNVNNLSNLKELWCHNNNLTSINVSLNLNLELFWCYGNNLTILNLNNNSKLVDLSCSLNQLSNLDLSNNNLLYRLYCNNNKLTQINLSQNIFLRNISIWGNPLKSIDVSKLNILEQLSLSDTDISSLNVSNNTLLRDLHIQRTPNLYCVQVNSTQLGNKPPMWSYDSQAKFSLTCN